MPASASVPAFLPAPASGLLPNSAPSSGWPAETVQKKETLVVIIKGKPM